jgi:hypothetical protein
MEIMIKALRKAVARGLARRLNSTDPVARLIYAEDSWLKEPQPRTIPITAYITGDDQEVKAL